MRQYMVCGQVVVDRVMPHGKQAQPEIRLGGGVMYAVAGLKIWTDACGAAAYTGRDFPEYYGNWLSENGIAADGFIPRFEHTNRADLFYLPNGTHAMGPGDPNYMNGGDLPDWQLVEPFLRGPGEKALHLIGADLTELLKQLQAERAKGLLVGYEMDPDESIPDMPEYIRQVTDHWVDFFSLSCEEVKGIVPGVRDLEDALEYMCALNCPSFFRAGTQGAYMIAGHKAHYSPMIDVFGSKDPTGCGNSSTAAAFYAMCEGHSPRYASMIGAVTASLNASCVGLVPRIDLQTRQRCLRLARDYDANFQQEELN
ncbi:carbohydrate kinase family protein [Candidatus Allofournierella merdipullorum]|uniref:carbohydrate kinase family protein n=1 Tax=Candidatus Allofournierella merdipullorum TaxID=2838595 RepID=UPI003AB78D81